MCTTLWGPCSCTKLSEPERHTDPQRRAGFVGTRHPQASRGLEMGRSVMHLCFAVDELLLVGDVAVAVLMRIELSVLRSRPFARELSKVQIPRTRTCPTIFQIETMFL